METRCGRPAGMPALRGLLLLGAMLAPRAGVAADTLLGRTDDTQPITLSIALPSRDPAGAAAFVAHVTTPGDPLYRQYLTPQDYAARFGAKEADYDAVVSWAQSRGLTVGERYVGRTVLPVRGTAASLGAAIGLTFNDYRDADGRVYHAASGRALLPASVAASVAGVVGLSTKTQYVPLIRRLPAGVHADNGGTGPNGAFSAADLRTIYNVPAQTLGPKQTLGLFEQGGFDPNDVQTYLTRNKLPAVPIHDRNVDGYGGLIDDTNVELEAVLDIDMQIAINPDSDKVVVYEDGGDGFPTALLDSLAAMASDDVAHVISISYGEDEALQGADAIAAENTVFTQLAAQGQAVFVASGDDGAYGDLTFPLNVPDPAAQPFVTAVGGTTVFTGNKQSYAVEEVWNDLADGGGASGGGISTVWPIPAYQLFMGGSVARPNGGSVTMRNVPDVAALADPLTGVAVYSSLNGGWLQVGGTSASAPIWAGFYSLVEAASEGLGFGNPGFANPAIYAESLSAGGLLFPNFHDVLQGNNSDLVDGLAPGFNAGSGYDNTTGWGSFDGANLLVALALVPAAANTDPPPPPNGLKATVTPTSITLTWTGAKVDSGYLAVAETYFGQALVGDKLQKAKTATFTGLSPNTTYLFQVFAVSPGGTTASVFQIVTTAKTAG